jgi:ATP:ADP antiporter, AAA family
LNQPDARRAIIDIWQLAPPERLKVALLSTWLFISIATLWLLKPIRTAALLSHLGAAELPYLRFGSVIGVGCVVFGYSRLTSRLSRLNLVRGASICFAGSFLTFWACLRLGGDALGSQRWFVWAMFILVDVYSTVMVAIFWTYTNDVVSRVEADRLYVPIGVGGILGGVAGGVAIDTLVAWISPVDMLLLCTAFVLTGGTLAWATEAILKPAPRVIDPTKKTAWMDTFEGARAVLRNRYLLAMVGIVLAYEFAATLTDFVINLVFERSFQSEVELAQMYGRLGWIVSSTALVTQLLIVPVLLPSKKIALLVPPLVMAAATLGLAALPVVPLAIGAAASDRGLNYSLQQVTKETLYLPLSDLERYKAKAFIDVFVDRAGKALSSVALLILVAFMDVSPRVSLALAFTSLMFWVACANALGRSYAKRVARRTEEREPELEGRHALQNTVD